MHGIITSHQHKQIMSCKPLQHSRLLHTSGRQHQPHGGREQAVDQLQQAQKRGRSRRGHAAAAAADHGRQHGVHALTSRRRQRIPVLCCQPACDESPLLKNLNPLLSLKADAAVASRSSAASQPVVIAKVSSTGAMSSMLAAPERHFTKSPRELVPAPGKIAQTAPGLLGPVSICAPL